MATTKHSVADFGKSDTMPTQKRTPKIQTKTKHQNPNAIRVAKCTNPRTAGTELMWQMTPGKESENSPYPQTTKSTNILYPNRPPSQKLKSPPLRFGEKVVARAYTIEDPPTIRRRFFKRMQRGTNAGLATTMECRNDPKT